ncbi:MAG: GTPase HflX, partial [Lentisphaeria bacterium]|nr:GTPase HflX [Lentisphaeria bacterium]
LGPAQQRNIEKFCKMQVYDRQEVILDIFASRAATREAVIQVELARNRYYLPRLAGAWSHLSRQQGGAIGSRGAGEKQIEYDRRMVKRKIASLEEELALVRKQRTTQRKSRMRGDVANCAIIGYTNAGKSTLLNALTNAGVLSEDKLFATLDPTTRKMTLPDKTELLLTDTVGFVRKLPHSLVEAFKSTLEEALLADFLLLVLDVSSPYVHSHWETTLAVLEELGAGDKELVAVFNKSDLLGDDLVALAKVRALAPEGILISSTRKSNFDLLCQKLSLLARRKNQRMQLCIPPDRQDLIALLHARGKIHESRWEEDGAFYAVADLSPVIRHKFEAYTAAGQR